MSVDVQTIDAGYYAKQSAKIRSSISWIVQVSSLNTESQHTYLNSKQPLLDANGQVTQETKWFLISGWPYQQVLAKCFKTFPSGNVFNAVIEVLCRNGLYLLGNDEPIITQQQLQDKSFNADAHLGIIDKLMRAVCSNLWSPVEKVVNSVKKFAPFFASRDLPNDTEEAIVLWLNKVQTRFKQLTEIEASTINGHLSPLSLQIDDVCDSCVLVMLLNYYCPDHIQINDIVIKDPMSISDALHNLNLALTFCYNKVFPQYQICKFRKFLSAQDFLQCCEEMRPNFFTFYSFLFYCFECEPVKGIVNPRGHSVTHVREVIVEPNLSARSTSSHRSRSADEDRDSTSHISALIPDAKALISEATKKSFHPKTPDVKSSSNLMSTNSQSDSDLSNSSVLHGIPQRPLLPKRNHEERPHSRHITTSIRTAHDPMQKSSSLHNINSGFDIEVPVDVKSKWQRNILTQPYSARSNTSTASSARSQPASPAKKFWEQSNVVSTGLLSKVDIGSDSEIEEIFSARDSVDDTTSSRTSNLAWSDFTATYNPSSSSTFSTARSNNVGDLTLETVRTLDYKTPLCSGRNDVTNSTTLNAGSSSDLTDVTNSLASGDSQFTHPSTVTDVLQAVVRSSEKSPDKSATHTDPKFTQGRAASQTSYIVSSGAFNTADSARAAGYPVISDRGNNLFERPHEIPTSPVVPMETELQSHDQRLMDIIDRMRGVAEQIRQQKLELEKQHHFMLIEKNQQQMFYKRDLMQMQLKQLKERTLIQEAKKEESSSDYSSKSPSPATSTRNDEPVVNGYGGPTPSLLQTSNFTLSPNRPSTPRDLTADVTLVQQRLDQLQRSVERERQKRKVNDLEKSIDGLQAELKSLEKFSPSPSHKSLNQQQKAPEVQPHLNLHREDSLQQGAPPVGNHSAEIKTTEASAPAVTRRTLFPSSAPSKTQEQSVRDVTVVHEMQYNQNHQTSQNTDHQDGSKAPHEITVSYDSFSCQLKTSSCQSTPAKSPLLGSPVEQQTDTETTMVHQNEVDKKGAMGFEIVDEKSPATKLAKKKEQFLLGRLKKEEEQRMKQMEREMESEKRKREAREHHEKLMQKKQDEKEKRDRRLKDYQRRKEQEEEAAHNTMKPGIISNTPVSSGKKTHKPKSNIAEQVEVLENIANLDLPTSSHHGSTRNLTYGVKSHRDEETESNGSGGSDYSGPKLFKQLISKSNRALINNALNHCCLPGKVNETVRKKTLRALDESSARHLMILFRDNKCQYRAIYSYNPDEEKLRKITGNGPVSIIPSMIEALFKYNSGRRTFNCVPSKTLAVSIDAITIKSSLWQHSKK
uniref:Calmodulin-regulated spectrin-associated protein 1 n=1 Tax=Phallusia mammillata TaxID=59560 RepID=A0A6F9D8W3_9ASCI|nr:calmodulin-regulated spectrin-associated protein 1 [Phallusia mammillata]